MSCKYGFNFQIIRELSANHKIIEIARTESIGKTISATQKTKMKDTFKKAKFLLSYTHSEQRANISLFLFDEIDMQLNSDIVIMLSQDLVHNKLTSIQEVPLEENKDSLSYGGVSHLRFNRPKKEMDSYELYVEEPYEEVAPTVINS
jgi:hypothetical protein